MCLCIVCVWFTSVQSIHCCGQIEFQLFLSRNKKEINYTELLFLCIELVILLTG